MSLTKSPRLNAIRFREEAADTRRNTAIIAILCGVTAFAIVGMLWEMMR